MEHYRLFNVCDVKEMRYQITNLLSALIDARKPSDKNETAWLIEWPATADSQVRWWHPSRGWTIDASRAARFCRKEDAEAFIDSRNMVQGIVATEHAWISFRADAAAA